MNRTAGYARLSVSTEESVSIVEQVRQINDECARRGWPVPEVFIDEGISGSKDIVRPQRDELERRIKAGDFDAAGPSALRRKAALCVSLVTCRTQIPGWPTFGTPSP